MKVGSVFGRGSSSNIMDSCLSELKEVHGEKKVSNIKNIIP